MADLTVKSTITEMIKQLPDTVGWEEVQYRLYVRQQIESGLADSDAGKVMDSEQMRTRLAAHLEGKRGQ